MQSNKANLVVSNSKLVFFFLVTVGQDLKNSLAGYCSSESLASFSLAFEVLWTLSKGSDRLGESARKMAHADDCWAEALYHSWGSAWGSGRVTWLHPEPLMKDWGNPHVCLPSEGSVLPLFSLNYRVQPPLKTAVRLHLFWKEEWKNFG